MLQNQWISKKMAEFCRIIVGKYSHFYKYLRDFGRKGQIMRYLVIFVELIDPAKNDKFQ